MVRECQKRAKERWDKKTTTFFFRLRNEEDADIIERLKSVSQRTDYLRELVRKDVKRATAKN